MELVAKNPRSTPDSISVAVIDNIILSVNKRIEAILTCKVHRTKYYSFKNTSKAIPFLLYFQASQVLENQAKVLYLSMKKGIKVDNHTWSVTNLSIM